MEYICLYEQLVDLKGITLQKLIMQLNKKQSLAHGLYGLHKTLVYFIVIILRNYFITYEAVSDPLSLWSLRATCGSSSSSRCEPPSLHTIQDTQG
jgi:hypothetical protein